MKLLELNQISKEGVKSLQQSFNNLPETSHKDGKYRLRRYSVVELRHQIKPCWNATAEVEITHLSRRNFIQSEDLNEFQGGMSRSFEGIKDTTLQSVGMKEACLLFKQSNGFVDGQEVEIHQIRVVTQRGMAEVSPEGVHQDGFDHIAMLGINSGNTAGGELMVYDSPKSEAFMIYNLNNGKMVMLDDKKLWHNAKPLISPNQGYADFLIFCAKV